jgi:class 3 adenylate cyclase
MGVSIRMETGTRGAATARPSGTVSFVLGDMVGSTRLWEDHAAVMPEVLARLDALVVEHADVRAGHRPPEQGEGDNFVVAFARPVDAVEFAADL